MRSLLLPKPPDINSRSVHHIATSPVTAKDHEIQTITTDNEKASNILFDGEKQDIDDDEVEFGGWESGNS